MESTKALYLAILIIVFLLIQSLGHADFRHTGTGRQQTGGIVLCPNRPAETNGKPLETFIVYRSTKSFEDFNIYNNASGWRVEDLDQLTDLGFDPNIPTILYIHPFRQNSSKPWLLDIRQQHQMLFQNPSQNSTPFNLFLYDWSTYSNMERRYASSYIPLLGLNLADFFKQLSKRYSIDFSNVQLFSFSLSTHLAGQAGRELASSGMKLSQITALDPTRTCFQTANNMFGRNYTLRSTDAELVVVRDYDFYGSGSQYKTGGVDIFVNGGRRQPPVEGRMSGRQWNFIPPSYDVTPTVYYGDRDDHNKAPTHEVATHGNLSDKCQEVAYKCDSYYSYLRGQCASCGPRNDECFFIDTMTRLSLPNSERVRIYPKNTQMFLKSALAPKPCLYLYQAILKLVNPSPLTRLIVTSGYVTFSLKTSPNTTFVPRNEDLRNGYFTALVEAENRLVEDEEVRIDFDEFVSSRDRKNLIDSIDSLDMNFMSHALEEERAKASTQFCTVDDNQYELDRC